MVRRRVRKFDVAVRESRDQRCVCVRRRAPCADPWIPRNARKLTGLDAAPRWIDEDRAAVESNLHSDHNRQSAGRRAAARDPRDIPRQPMLEAPCGRPVLSEIRTSVRRLDRSRTGSPARRYRASRLRFRKRRVGLVAPARGIAAFRRHRSRDHRADPDAVGSTQCWRRIASRDAHRPAAPPSRRPSAARQPHLDHDGAAHGRNSTCSVHMQVCAILPSSPMRAVHASESLRLPRTWHQLRRGRAPTPGAPCIRRCGAACGPGRGDDATTLRCRS